MSGRVVSAVFGSVLPAWLKPYASALASFAADDGTRVYPTVATIARMVGRCERATQYALRELERRGVLTIVAAPTPRHATRYHFRAVALPQLGDPDQLALFPHPGVHQSRHIPRPPDVFHSHAQVLTGSGLHPRGAVGCTRSVIDPSFTHPQEKRARARSKGKYQKPGTE